MKGFKTKIIYLRDKYSIYLFLSFAILTLIPYVSVFSNLEANTNGGLIFRCVVFCLFSVIFLICFLCKKEIPNKAFILCLLLYLITQVITIFISPKIKKIDVPTIQSLAGLGIIFSNIFTFLIAWYLLNGNDFNHEHLKITAFFLIGIGIASCLYTYIFQYKEISAVLTNEHGWNYQVTSIYTSKGIYGFILLIVSICTIILTLNTKKYWLYIFPVFFLFNSFLCRAKTSILCILIILVFALVYHFIKSWKTYKKQWTFALSISTGIILIVAILTFVPGMQFGPFEKLNYFFTETILKDGVTVTKDRIEKIANIFKAVDYPLGIMFGCGERITNYIIAPAGAEIRGDNQYAANYATGGLIKSILYIGLIIYTIYKIAKRKGEYKSFSILFVTIMLITGLFDDNSFLGVNYCFLLIAPFIYSNPFKTEEIK